MKFTPPTREEGFTLMELLVVITIIAVLAGLAIPTMSIIQEKAREAQAHSGVHGLMIAITGFQADYNRLPKPGSIGGETGADEKFDTDSSNELINILLGKDPAGNPKDTSFLTPPMARNDANGLISTGGASYELVDPWSTAAAHQYYHIVLDYGEDHKIENPVRKEASKFSPSFIAAQPADIIADAAVYSGGNPRKSPASRKAITSW